MLGRHLFWLENCSDEFLLEVYSEASGLVVSSRAEGYSLPIVKAKILGCQFLRDIAVFREIGLTYGNITFYTGDKPEGIARQFLKWKSNLAGKTFEKEGSKTICWKKATKDLQKIIID